MAAPLARTGFDTPPGGDDPHGKTGATLRNLLYANPIYRLTLMGKAPDALRLAPPPLRPGDAARGRDIRDGWMWLENRRRRFDPDTLHVEGAGRETLAELHGFAWLADLIADGSPAALALARGLTRVWLDGFAHYRPLPWRPDVIGRRLSSWLAAFEFLSAGNDGLGPRLLEQAAMQARHLGRACRRAPPDARAFDAAKGLLYAAVLLPGSEDLLDGALALIGAGIDRQILADGGHIQRNPSLHIAVLETLIDLRALLRSVHIEVPVPLQGAIDRMAPMARAMRLGDGGLALFNGSFEEGRARIDAVLASSGVRAKALLSAPHSGFQRLQAGRAVLVVDVGRAPPEGARRLMHAGTLAFEMSVGKDRLIVNCGARPGEGRQWLEAMRATQAHSALSIDDTGSSLFPGPARGGHDEDRIGPAPFDIRCLRKEADGAIWLDTAHDGYARTVGVIHRRRFYLDASGEDLRGEDLIEGSGGSAFAANFHLHPDIHASLVQGRKAVLLKLPSGEGWRFMASGGVISLAESLYAGAAGNPRRGERIVVSGPLHGDGADIKWRLAKIK